MNFTELTNAFFVWKCLSEAMLMYYAFTPDSIFKLVCLMAQNLLDEQVCYTQILFP